MDKQDTTEILRLVRTHKVHVKKNYLLHYYMNDRYRRTHWILGGILTISSAATAVCAVIFFSQDKPSIIPAIASVITFVLAALMTFLNLANQAASHKQAASNYYCVSLKCLSFLADPELGHLSAEQYRKQEGDIADHVGCLEKDSPTIPAWAYHKSLTLIQQYDDTSAAVDKIEKEKTANQALDVRE